MPAQISRCLDCGWLVADYLTHEKCWPINAFNTKMFGETLAPSWKIKFDPRHEVVFFDSQTDSFVPFSDKKLLSTATSGVFCMSENVISYDSTKFVKFTIFIAKIESDKTMLVQRCTNSRSQGLMVSKVDMDMKDWKCQHQFNLNTALVIGIKSHCNVDWCFNLWVGE